MIEKLRESYFRKPNYLIMDKINEIIDEVNKLQSSGFRETK